MSTPISSPELLWCNCKRQVRFLLYKVRIEQLYSMIADRASYCDCDSSSTILLKGYKNKCGTKK